MALVPLGGPYGASWIFTIEIAQARWLTPRRTRPKPLLGIGSPPGIASDDAYAEIRARVQEKIAALR